MNSAPSITLHVFYAPSLFRALAAIHDADAQLLGLHAAHGQNRISEAMECHRKGAAILNRYLSMLEANDGR